MDFIILTIILIVLTACIILKNNSKFKPEQKNNSTLKPEQKSNFVRKSRTNHIFYKH